MHWVGNSSQLDVVQRAKSFANCQPLQFTTMQPIARYSLIAVAIMGTMWGTVAGQKRDSLPPVPPELEAIIQDSTNWWMQSSWHFQVYGRPLSTVYEDFNLITDSLEKSLKVVTTRLKIRDAGLFQWYGLPGPVDADGHVSKAYPEFGVVLATYVDTLRHFATREVIHVLLGRTWGTPRSMFMREGLACALEGSFSMGKERWDVHTNAQSLVRQGRVPSIAKLERDFDNYRQEVSWSVAGSFLDFLINRFGVAPVKALYQLAGTRDFSEMFEKIYGHRLTDVEREWLQTLR
jgi:hypothetical protein